MVGIVVGRLDRMFEVRMERPRPSFGADTGFCEPRSIEKHAFLAWMIEIDEGF